MQVFVSPDADGRDVSPAYLGGNRRHPDGYVINFGPLPGRHGMWLHSARCSHINGTPARGKSFTRSFGKACSTDRAELESWAGREAPGRLTAECFRIQVAGP